MKPYDEWIKTNYPTRLEAVGMCGTATRRMCEAFPELARVAGWLSGRDHWWCVTPDGSIVDPTRVQYDFDGGDYRVFQPGDEVRVGKCMNCGEDIYRSVDCLEGAREIICSDECHASYSAYLMEGVR